MLPKLKTKRIKFFPLIVIYLTVEVSLLLFKLLKSVMVLTLEDLLKDLVKENVSFIS